MNVLTWADGEWLNEPDHTTTAHGFLAVRAAPGSDFWRQTYYGFTRESGHALLYPFPQDTAVEVSFVADFEHLYDQAGVIVRSGSFWMKAGVEHSDGLPMVGAVVTNETSDWSCAPVPDWQGKIVTIRVSRLASSLIVRARVSGGPWRLVRVASIPVPAIVVVGPYCASPERDGLTVTFTGIANGPADRGLHQEAECHMAELAF